MEAVILCQEVSHIILVCFKFKLILTVNFAAAEWPQMNAHMYQQLAKMEGNYKQT